MPSLHDFPFVAGVTSGIAISAALAIFVLKYDKLWTSSSVAPCGGTTPCVHERDLASERAGRVRAQRSMRDMVNRTYSGTTDGDGTPDPRRTRGYDCLPIASVESCFRRRSGAPRQGMLAPDARAHVVFAPAIPATALQGLAEYSHVFLLFLFHENTDAHKQAGAGAGVGAPRVNDAHGKGQGQGRREDCSPPGVDNAALQARPFQALIEAPALAGARTGVFSTRSPHRPNAIGLSLVRLLAVHDEGGKGGRRVLIVAGCDLVEGTPVLDVKPAAPYDCPTCIGGLMRQAGGGGGRGEEAQFSPPRDLAAARSALSTCSDVSPSSFTLNGPDWSFATLRDMASSRLPVVWGEGVVEWVRGAMEGGATRLYGPACLAVTAGKGEGEVSCLLRAISQTLALDIRAVHHGRGGGARARAVGAGWNAREGTSVQEYELFFDTLHVQFTYREGEAEGGVGDAHKPCTYVHIHRVSVAAPDRWGRGPPVQEKGVLLGKV